MKILDNIFTEDDKLDAMTVAEALEKQKQYIEENAVQGPKGEKGDKGETGDIALVYKLVRTTEIEPNATGGFIIPNSHIPSLSPFNRSPKLNDQLTIIMKGTGSLDGRVWLLSGVVLSVSITQVYFSYSSATEISGPQGEKGDKGDDGIPEAPIDNKVYGRQDGEWTNINTLIESAITGFLSEGEIEVSEGEIEV